MARSVLYLALALSLTSLSRADDQQLVRHRQRLPNWPEIQTHDPLFAVAVLGKKAETAMWMVLDKSDDATDYNVLYVDLDSDGDLTDENERLVGSKADRTGKMEFKLAEFKDAEGREHKELKVSTSGSQMIGVRWLGKWKVGGGYPTDPDLGYMRFGESPQAAPIVWIAPDAPLQFQRWYGRRFKIGAEGELQIFLGQKGIGENSFCAFQEHVLQEGEGLVATLLYEDIGGNQRTTTYALKDKC